MPVVRWSPPLSLSHTHTSRSPVLPRFLLPHRSENILALELDLPERSTFAGLDTGDEAACAQAAGAMGAVTWQPAEPERYMVYVHVSGDTGQNTYLGEDVGKMRQGGEHTDSGSANKCRLQSCLHGSFKSCGQLCPT